MAADRDFRLIAITPEHPVEMEGAKIRALLENGWYRVHLRHPSASRTELRDIIESVPLQLHDRLVLNGHFDLANDYNLGGLHLNRRCPSPPPLYNGHLSRSCHSLEEIADCTCCTYVTLSPIFDSISKHGYRSGFSQADFYRLEDTGHTDVYALGGVDCEKIPILRRFNFRGAALLGDIPWAGDISKIKEYSQKITAIC